MCCRSKLATYSRSQMCKKAAYKPNRHIIISVCDFKKGADRKCHRTSMCSKGKYQFSRESFSSSLAPNGVSVTGKVSPFSHMALGPVYLSSSNFESAMVPVLLGGIG